MNNQKGHWGLIPLGMGRAGFLMVAPRARADVGHHSGVPRFVSHGRVPVPLPQNLRCPHGRGEDRRFVDRADGGWLRTLAAALGWQRRWLPRQSDLRPAAIAAPATSLVWMHPGHQKLHLLQRNSQQLEILWRRSVVCPTTLKLASDQGGWRGRDVSPCLGPLFISYARRSFRAAEE